MPSGAFNLLHLSQPRMRMLHLTWLAFFLSFVIWFNHAPLMAAIRTSLGLSNQQVAALLILNVALTIPARIVVGMLVDKVGPRRMYSGLLGVSGLLCITFALATDFTTLAITRFLLGCVGAGFVVGIRMIAEWFPARETGLAQGIYAGFGNFGSAAAAVSLPSIALMIGGPDSWRWAMAITGLIAIAYAVLYYFSVSDTPAGATYFSPKKTGAMEVTSRADFLLYAAMQAPMVLALALLAWKLGPGALKLLPEYAVWLCYATLAAYLVYQIADMWRINAPMLRGAPVPEIHRYRFRQVAVLNVCYCITFGSELAVVSTLPLFFKDVFGLSLAMAGFLGASFGTTTFFARPLGGWLSDRFGRKPVLFACLGGTALGYIGMSFMGVGTGMVFAVAVTFICSLFVNGGNGATYAMLPMIKRRLTGQIAGMVGAYGNVGSVLYLTLYASVPVSTFYLITGCTAVIGFCLVWLFIDEPRGQIAEFMPDGTLTLIDVT